MKNEYDFGFLDYDYYGEDHNDPLYILMINEQFEVLRNSFNELDENTKNILDYFIIQREDNQDIEVDIDKYIEELKSKYFDLYNIR